ncbi:MAG: hypothetical protein NTV86_07825 [Planctomycetota bacterium]|nr:hypothetical protein [Planctomycetota bacterium]
MNASVVCSLKRPGADLRKSAEGLGDRYIFSYKPNPAALAAETWDPVTVRKGLREAVQIARGCVLEIIMKDTHTCRHQPQRIWDWVRIAKEVAGEGA